MCANQQQVEHIRLLAKDKTQAQADTELIKLATQFSQTQVTMRLAKGGHQSRQRIEHLILNGQRQGFELAVVTPGGLNSHCGLPWRERLARTCAA